MKKSLAIGACVLAIALIIEHQWKKKRRPFAEVPAQDQLVQLKQETNPAPEMIAQGKQIHVATNTVEAGKTVLERVVANDPEVRKISSEQIAHFLERNKTNADSLLAAFNVTKDKEYLRTAMRNFSNNPAVLLAALTSDLFPDERRAWLEQFKNAAGDNPLANYMSARDYLASQQPELAFKEMADALPKGGFDDFGQQRLQELEELYLSSGHSPAEAKALASNTAVYPHLREMRDLEKDLSDMQMRYVSAGDPDSAQMIARMGLNLAANIETPGGANSQLSQMTGVTLERDVLNQLDPNVTYDFLQQPVKDRLDALQEREKALREQGSFFDGWFRQASEPDLVSYFDRLKMYGEEAALVWAKNRSVGN